VHKGSHGRVLIIGGGTGMPGALRLAGESAMRVGAGLVTVAGAPENLVPVIATRPELIYLPAADGAGLDEAIRGATVIAIGPGLGRGDWAQRLWSRVSRTQGLPVVVDADALNLLASSPVKLPPDWILTPHPGEAARLLGCETRAVQADRPGAARALQARYGAVVVLKGAGTLVACPAGESSSQPDLYLCDRGNPGMATAGMGDVLTGVIAGLRAQIGDDASEPRLRSGLAARLGVLVHALAGDSAATRGQRGLMAGDVVAELRGWVNP
jgi:NAD(P)H-hydrate epimerase